MKNSNACRYICFECPYRDCIIGSTDAAPSWEKEFNREQRRIRQEKRKKKAAGSGAPGKGTLLSLRLR